MKKKCVCIGSFGMVISVADASMLSCGCQIGMDAMHVSSSYRREYYPIIFGCVEWLNYQKYDPIQACHAFAHWHIEHEDRERVFRTKVETLFLSLPLFCLCDLIHLSVKLLISHHSTTKSEFGVPFSSLSTVRMLLSYSLETLSLKLNLSPAFRNVINHWNVALFPSHSRKSQKKYRIFALATPQRWIFLIN